VWHQRGSCPSASLVFSLDRVRSYDINDTGTVVTCPRGTEAGEMAPIRITSDVGICCVMGIVRWREAIEVVLEG